MDDLIKQMKQMDEDLNRGLMIVSVIQIIGLFLAFLFLVSALNNALERKFNPADSINTSSTEINSGRTHEVHLSEAEQLGGDSELRQMVAYGVDELNNSGVCGVITVSDHFTRGALARWGAGKVAPGTPQKRTKMNFRFSYKTCHALTASELHATNRQCLPDCRFSSGERSQSRGETWGISDKVRNVSYI